MQALSAPPVQRSKTSCRACDVAIAVVALLVVLVGSRVASSAQPERENLDVVGYLLLGLSAATTLLRRRTPRLFVGSAVGLASAYLALGYPYGPTLLVLALASGTLAFSEPPRQAWVLLGVCAAVLVGAAFVGEYDGGPGNWFGASVQFGWVLIPGIIGTLARSDRQSRQQATVEAERRVDEQSRLRLAREVHDVVGHDLSVISLQAGVALHVLDREPEKVRDALEAIRRTSTDALDELRATLAMTRGDALDARRDTGAGLDRLPGIVAGLELCGLHVEIKNTDAQIRSRTADLVAFRIIQESLTNVLRHSAATSVEVSLAHEAASLTIEVTDPGPARMAPGPPGRGLAGLAERVAEIGGAIEAGPSAFGWQVRATLPDRSDREST